MSEININLKLRPRQARVFSCPKTYTVLIAGRRWGKTTLALTRLIVHAYMREGSLCYYIAPNYRQAKRIAWTVLKALIPPGARCRTSEQELSIELPNRSVIQLHGADRPDSLRGVGLDFVVLDEYAYMDPETWSTVVWPALADRRGGALFIGTPAGFNNHLYDLYMDAKQRENWATFHFRSDEGGYVSEDRLAEARAHMDPQRYAQEFEASFETLQSRVYHAFDRERNVMDLELLPYAPVLIGMDFNISPMTAVIGHKVGDECHIIDEIVLMNSNTQEMMEEINRRYGGREGIVHPDPSGVARKTSAPVGESDFTIIAQFGWPIYRTKIYPVVDRINSVNAMLCNAQGQRRLLISPSCTHLIKALDGLTYKQDTKLPDKSSGLQHITDALGYMIMGVFPLVDKTSWAVSKVWL